MSRVKVAIPVANAKLCLHFGHCEQFAVIDADTESREILAREDLVPPPHEPGVLPRWLAGQGVEVVLAAGMGQRAQSLFMEQNIKVVAGVEGDSPEQLVLDYLGGSLRSGANLCDH